MKCDRCGWRISKRDYDGDGECYCCFHGEMTSEMRPGRPRKLPVVRMENGKAYFIDDRLRQLRNVDNPNDFIDYRDRDMPPCFPFEKNTEADAE